MKKLADKLGEGNLSNDLTDGPISSKHTPRRPLHTPTAFPVAPPTAEFAAPETAVPFSRSSDVFTQPQWLDTSDLLDSFEMMQPPPVKVQKIRTDTWMKVFERIDPTMSELLKEQRWIRVLDILNPENSAERQNQLWHDLLVQQGHPIAELYRNNLWFQALYTLDQDAAEHSLYNAYNIVLSHLRITHEGQPLNESSWYNTYCKTNPALARKIEQGLWFEVVAEINPESYKTLQQAAWGQFFDKKASFHGKNIQSDTWFHVIERIDSDFATKAKHELQFKAIDRVHQFVIEQIKADARFKILEDIDHETAQHSLRVQKHTEEAGRYVSLPPGYIETKLPPEDPISYVKNADGFFSLEPAFLKRLGLYTRDHDIGKLRIDDIHKSTKLPQENMMKIKERGRHMVDRIRADLYQLLSEIAFGDTPLPPTIGSRIQNSDNAKIVHFMYELEKLSKKEGNEVLAIALSTSPPTFSDYKLLPEKATQLVKVCKEYIDHIVGELYEVNESFRRINDLSIAIAYRTLKILKDYEFRSLMIPEGNLLPEEIQEFRLHALHGWEVSQNRTELAKTVFLHHERVDGNQVGRHVGYPFGTVGGLFETSLPDHLTERDEDGKISLKEHVPYNGKTPFAARLIAAADVLDALLSKRSYKEAFSFKRTLSILVSEINGLLDPEVVKAVLAYVACNFEALKLQYPREGNALFDDIQIVNVVEFINDLLITSHPQDPALMNYISKYISECYTRAHSANTLL